MTLSEKLKDASGSNKTFILATADGFIDVIEEIHKLETKLNDAAEKRVEANACIVELAAERDEASRRAAVLERELEDARSSLSSCGDYESKLRKQRNALRQDLHKSSAKLSAVRLLAGKWPASAGPDELRYVFQRILSVLDADPLSSDNPPISNQFVTNAEAPVPPFHTSAFVEAPRSMSWNYETNGVKVHVVVENCRVR